MPGSVVCAPEQPPVGARSQHEIENRKIVTVVLVQNLLSSIFIFWYTNHGSWWLSGAIKSIENDILKRKLPKTATLQPTVLLPPHPSGMHPPLPPHARSCLSTPRTLLPREDWCAHTGRSKVQKLTSRVVLLTMSIH